MIMAPTENVLVRKPYHMPKLSRYGSIAEMTTAMKGKNTDNGGMDANKS